MIYIGGVSTEPTLCVCTEEHIVTVPLKRTDIEILLRQLAEALPHAPK